MPSYIEKAEVTTLPVVVLKGTVAFPSITINIEINDDESINTVKKANEYGSYLIFLTAKEIKDPPYDEDDLYKVGTVVKIKQSLMTQEGSLRIIAEGISRAVISGLHIDENGSIIANALCKTLTLSESGVKGEAYIREALDALESVASHLPTPADDLLLAAKAIDDPGFLSDFIASSVMVKYDDKQTVLQCFEPINRIETLIYLLRKEKQLLECEMDIHKRVRARLGQMQKERYLHEQMRVIQDELGMGGDNDDDFYSQIIAAKLPKEVEEKLLKENEHLAKTPFGAAEGVVLRNYLETCLELPWTKTTKDRVDVKIAAATLDKDHDGLEKVKERILEHIAVKQLCPEHKGQIICLVGPPGVGKTSIASSLAKAMKRNYVRVSLGGIHDEADIRGHRKTYVGAMPGRIVNALIQAKARNPLILLDEVDKIGHSSAHGDPASALLEVLDSEQNKTFRDHFVELPFDLSDCMFIATANTLETVPRPLIDRMEIIELKAYTRTEKMAIAKNHLIPKQLKRHGLTKRTCKITDEAIGEIIEYYTREAGVRGLEKQIAAICRKAAKKIVAGDSTKETVSLKNLKDYLGSRKLIPQQISGTDEIGLVNGLAYTEVGGDMLEIETAILDGTGKIELTGSLGDVMKESAHAAVSYIRSKAKELGIPSDFYKTKDIHIHVPEGATPKDGPSAGITMMTSLVSALTGTPVRREVAMTGEITLRGRVLAIGGLKEKTMAAYIAGVREVIIPADNVRDIEEIDPEARENLIFIPCKTADEVLRHALATNKKHSSFLNTKEDISVNNTDISDYSRESTEARTY